jgi:hypothetical protein
MFGYPDFAERLRGHQTDAEADVFILAALKRAADLGLVNCRSAVRDDPGGERTHVVECFIGPLAPQIQFDEPAPRGDVG